MSEKNISVAAGAAMWRPSVIRAKGGRFVSIRCPDLNCGGELADEGDGWLRCDGLTYDTDDGPLRECYHYVEGMRP